MDVDNKRYYTEKLQILMETTELIYKCLDSHIENSENWNGEFSFGALRRCDDVLYN